MKHTICNREGRFLLSSSPQIGPVSLRLAQRRIQFHARTFRAFEAGSSDTRDSEPLQQVTCVTLFSLLHACATICHFTLEIRRLCAWMRRAPASFWGGNSSKRLDMSNKPPASWASEDTYRNPAGVQLRQRGVRGVNMGAKWLRLERGFKL